MDPEQRLRVLQQDLHRQQGKRDAVTRRVEEEEKRVAYVKQQQTDYKQAIEVLQMAVATRREELKVRVESLVTRGLRAVFGRPDMEFYLEMKPERGVVTTTPMLRSLFRGKVLETEIVEGHGGGVADVVGFILRVIVLCMARPKAAPVLVLDEPFKHVSADLRPGCAQLVRELNKTAGIQFIIITHAAELLDCADVIHRSSLQDGMTAFTLEHDLRDDAYHSKPAADAKAPDRANAWDMQDMVGNTRGADPILGEVDDGLARIQRTTGLGFGIRRARHPVDTRPKESIELPPEDE